MASRPSARHSVRKMLRAVGMEDASLQAYRKWKVWKRRGVQDIFARFPPYSKRVEFEAIHGRDPVRHSTMAMALTRIDTDKVPGHLAEVGVYRGGTARFIRLANPDRTYYLFDTFEGFPERDLEVKSDTRFRDTSVEAVLAYIGDTSRIIVRKGYFPETAAGLESEQFAFVSLDVDLYKPTLAALEFFYPRVPRGGYIFINDYNSPESNHGSSRAPHEFLADKPELLLEIPDKFGSVFFRKI